MYRFICINASKNEIIVGLSRILSWTIGTLAVKAAVLLWGSMYIISVCYDWVFKCDI